MVENVGLSPETVEIAAKLEEEAKDLDVIIYASGLFSCSVCSPLPQDEVVKRMEARLSGTRNGWVPSGDATFSTGEPSPGPCERYPKTHKHYLFDA